MSLSDKYIIPSSPGFNKIFTNPDLSFNEGNFFVLGKMNNVSNPRLGISIKKRDYNLAVHRNFLKRKVKNSFKDCVDRLPPLDFVVVVKSGENRKDINDSLGPLWKRCMVEKNE